MQNDLVILTNCPNCGLAADGDQQFCRSCGAALRATASNFGDRSALIGILLAFGGIIIALTGKMILNQELLVFIGVVTSIMGMVSIAVTPLLAKGRYKKPRQMSFHPQASLAPSEPTLHLPPIDSLHEIPSVVESTTELLKEPVRRA